MLKSDKTITGIPVSQLTNGSEAKVILVCDTCKYETTTTWHNYIQYQRKRGWTGATSCQKCAVKLTSANNKGKKRDISIARRNSIRRGKEHPSWKGGRYVASDGYIMIKDPSIPTNGWKAYRKEHILIMEKTIGRRLTKDEVIHHKNGDKQDNQLSNLWLTNQKGHREAHISLQDLGYQLMKMGLIDFDDELGIYFLADVKLRELLGQPDEANQQPSLSGNTLEGSETRSESLKDNNSPKSAGRRKLRR